MGQQTQSSKKVVGKKQSPVEKATISRTVSRAKHEWAQPVTQEERHRMITEAAYFIAEQRGFQGDLSLDDWLQAEAEVDTQFALKH
jgi:hypothetical protein